MTARKPRYRVVIGNYGTGWEWWIEAPGDIRPIVLAGHTSSYTERAAQAAARRLLAAIRAGEVDETEIGG